MNKMKIYGITWECRQNHCGICWTKNNCHEPQYKFYIIDQMLKEQHKLERKMHFQEYIWNQLFKLFNNMNADHILEDMHVKS